PGFATDRDDPVRRAALRPPQAPVLHRRRDRPGPARDGALRRPDRAASVRRVDPGRPDETAERPVLDGHRQPLARHLEPGGLRRAHLHHRRIRDRRRGHGDGYSHWRLQRISRRGVRSGDATRGRRLDVVARARRVLWLLAALGPRLADVLVALCILGAAGACPVIRLPPPLRSLHAGSTRWATRSATASPHACAAPDASAANTFRPVSLDRGRTPGGRYGLRGWKDMAVMTPTWNTVCGAATRGPTRSW